MDKFEPVSGCGDVDHGQEVFGELVVACGNGPVDFQASKEPLDLVALLVEFAVVVDLHAAVGTTGDDGLYVPARKVGADGIGVVAPFDRLRTCLSARSALGVCSGMAIRAS